VVSHKDILFARSNMAVMIFWPIFLGSGSPLRCVFVWHVMLRVCALCSYWCVCLRVDWLGFRFFTARNQHFWVHKAAFTAHWLRRTLWIRVLLYYRTSQSNSGLSHSNERQYI